MHDEVSETENIRKNLAIERLFADGCELLLDSNQVFIRQGICHLCMTTCNPILNVIFGDHILHGEWGGKNALHTPQPNVFLE